MVKLVNQTIFASAIKKKKILLFTATDLCALLGMSAVAMAGTLHRYKKQGFIVQVKRGLYALAESALPDLYVANKIYSPSYISCAFALSYHGVLPEIVYEITSVTTKATRRFETMGKIFSYSKIKKAAYTGYTLHQQQGIGFYIADAEKAFVDESYLRMLSGREPLERFHTEKIDVAKARNYALLFGNARLLNVLTTILP